MQMTDGCAGIPSIPVDSVLFNIDKDESYSRVYSCWEGVVVAEITKAAENALLPRTVFMPSSVVGAQAKRPTPAERG